MELNLEVCKTIAIQHGLPLQFVVKEFYVFDVLGQVAAKTAGSGAFVFKGGTALNKVFLGKTQRFSEDLDFDFNAPVKATYEKARELGDSLAGFQVKEYRRVKDTVQFYCGYETPFNTLDHVRVDVASKKIITSKPLIVKQAASEYSKQSVVGFKVYALEDLAARKMHALSTRCEGKDVYDVSNAIPLCGSMSEALKKMLESENEKESLQEFLDTTSGRLEKADAKKLRNQTNPFIPFSYRPKDWAALKNDLTERIKRIQT